MSQRTTSLTGLRCVLAILVGLPCVIAAQTGPPIPGATGTVALQGTIDQEYGAANTVIVKTSDGVRHLLHATKGVLVHGGQGTGEDALRGLAVGTPVAVHYSAVDGNNVLREVDALDEDGLRTTEGTINRVDRRGHQITIRFDNGTVETLQLSEGAATSLGHTANDVPDTGRIVVYYTDESGKRVVHYFRRKS
jgi:hypothetical protein